MWQWLSQQIFRTILWTAYRVNSIQSHHRRRLMGIVRIIRFSFPSFDEPSDFSLFWPKIVRKREDFGSSISYGRTWYIKVPMGILVPLVTDIIASNLHYFEKQNAECIEECINKEKNKQKQNKKKHFIVCWIFILSVTSICLLFYFIRSGSFLFCQNLYFCKFKYSLKLRNDFTHFAHLYHEIHVPPTVPSYAREDLSNRKPRKITGKYLWFSEVARYTFF